MKTENQPETEDISLISLAQNYATDDKAREFLESLRWPNGPTCPHCQNDGNPKLIYRLNPRTTSKTPGRKGLYSCAACRKQFTVKVGTIFEDSHIPVSKWVMAFFILCSSKKAISAHQMHRMLGITYKTAWLMCRRIRHVMRADSDGPKLTGKVEVDETFIGGKGDRRTKLLRKTPVVALIQRDGEMRTAVVSNVTQKNLRQTITECVPTMGMTEGTRFAYKQEV